MKTQCKECEDKQTGTYGIVGTTSPINKEPKRFYLYGKIGTISNTFVQFLTDEEETGVKEIGYLSVSDLIDFYHEHVGTPTKNDNRLTNYSGQVFSNLVS